MRFDAGEKRFNHPSGGGERKKSHFLDGVFVPRVEVIHARPDNPAPSRTFWLKKGDRRSLSQPEKSG